MGPVELRRGATATELRLIELARLDTLWLALWPLAIQGDLKVVDGLRTMERRAAICGLNVPTKVRMPVLTEEDFLRAIETVERQIAGLEGGLTDDFEEDPAEG